jgi:glycogen operon protein
MRALLTTLFVSRGSPMLTAGDEFGRTQRGNNNAYAQDNDVTWLDWENADGDLKAFVGRLIEVRKSHPSLSADRFLTGAPLDASEIPDVVWLNPSGEEMSSADWARERALGVVLYAPAGDAKPGDRTVVWINGATARVPVRQPSARDGFTWRLAVDSFSGNSPRDAWGGHEEPFELPPQSVLVFAEARVAP